MARKDGLPIRWPEPSHAKGDTGMLPGRLPWRGARGRSLTGTTWAGPCMNDPKYRKKPLSIKTRRSA